MELPGDLTMTPKVQLKWQDVESSNVKSVAYDSQSMTLAVKFMSNAGPSIYSYDGVGEQVYTTLVNADSIGRYLNMAIKGSYPYLKHHGEESLLSHVQIRREAT